MKKGLLLFSLLWFCLPTILCAYGSAEVWLKDKHKIEVETVQNRAEKSLGLGNREKLDKGRGMLFLYDGPGERIFWMKRMKIPIDILWIYQNKLVLIEREVPPPPAMTRDQSLPTYGHGVYADKVLEVKAGLSDLLGLKLGDAVRIEF